MWLIPTNCRDPDGVSGGSQCVACIVCNSVGKCSITFCVEPMNLLAFPFSTHIEREREIASWCSSKLSKAVSSVQGFNTTFDQEFFTRHLATPVLQSEHSLPSLLNVVRHQRRSLVAVTSGLGTAPIDSVLHCLLTLPRILLSLHLQIPLAALCIGCLHLSLWLRPH